MKEGIISADVAAFLSEHVESYEELQVLLLLAAHPERAWSCAEVIRQLTIPAVVAEAALRELAREQLIADVESEGLAHFRYVPRSSRLAASVAKVVQCHHEHRVAIVKLLTARAIQRLRQGLNSPFSNEPAAQRETDLDGALQETKEGRGPQSAK